jgi:hypothetical protein
VSLLAVDWGPVGVWAGAIATFLAALIALLGSVGGFDPTGRRVSGSRSSRRSHGAVAVSIPSTARSCGCESASRTSASNRRGVALVG